jgi:hypothetical protein
MAAIIARKLTIRYAELLRAATHLVSAKMRKSSPKQIVFLSPYEPSFYFQKAGIKQAMTR